MGGNHSKEEKKPEPVQQRIPISSLKNDDVVVLRGEAYADYSKLFMVNFWNGNDIAFHFKVILTETEGLFNKVKMNSKTGGKWGSEEIKDNLIYLNHFFELKFTCLQEKFSVDVDGNHFCDYNHRVSPDKITSISIEGDVCLNFVDVPNKVNLASEDNNEEHIPTYDEVEAYVKSLTDNVPVLRAGSEDEEFERLSNLITDGLQITKILLKEKKGSLFKNITKYGGYLSKAFSAGQAFIGVIKFVMNYGEPSDMEKVITKLTEISEELKRIEEAINQGFADVIEHMDLIQFREEVTIPLRTMFDLYIRCYTVSGKLPIKEFKEHCDAKIPRKIFSAMLEFLDGRKNIFETHLKANKYVFSVCDEWSTAMYNHATKLIVMNMFYYGLLCAEYADEGNSGTLINEQQEITNMINRLKEMAKRLKQIEEDRMKTFHAGGHAKHFLSEKFKEVKYFLASYGGPLPNETLAQVAYQMKNSWKGFNGPTDYYIMVVRGGDKDTRLPLYAGWHIGDEQRVTVVDGIGKVTKDADDCITLALIQPMTDDIRKVNETVNKDHQDALKKVVHEATGKTFTGARTCVKRVMEFMPSIPFKPLLVMYNVDFAANTTNAKVDEPLSILPINYTLTSEAWSCPGGPFPQKYFWKNLTVYPRTFQLNQWWRRQVQVVFQ